MDLRGIWWDGVNWIHVFWDRHKMARSCEEGNEPSDSLNGNEFKLS
jgi:hypothetical protein